MTSNRVSYELFMLRGPTPGAVYPLLDKSLTVGRDPLSDIPVNDPEVSRQHALVITTSKGDYRIQDLGSTNGTFIDGVRVGSKAETLQPSNAIAMGSAVTFIFRESTTIAESDSDNGGDNSIAVEEEPAKADSKSDVSEPDLKEQQRVKPDIPVGEPVKESRPAEAPVESDQGAIASQMPGDIRQPNQIEAHNPADVSPNLILGFVLLLLCSCATILLFLIFLRGDWLLRQAGLVP